MGLLSFGRRAQPRRFAYQPRYYDPSRDDNLKRRMHIQSAARSKRKSPGIIRLALILAMALYLYIVLA